MVSSRCSKMRNMLGHRSSQKAARLRLCKSPAGCMRNSESIPNGSSGKGKLKLDAKKVQMTKRGRGCNMEVEHGCPSRCQKSSLRQTCPLRCTYPRGFRNLRTVEGVENEAFEPKLIITSLPVGWKLQGGMLTDLPIFSASSKPKGKRQL